MNWRRRVKTMRFDRDLSTKDRMCLPTQSDFPSYPDESAEFYRAAFDLAWQMRSPIMAVYHAAIAGLVALAIIVLVVIGSQALDRKLPVHDVIVKNLTPIVPQGGRIALHYDLVRDRPCAVDITASIIDGADASWPLVTLHRDVTGASGPDHFTRSWQVPPEAAPGPSRLRVGWAYACPGNYLQALSPIPLAFSDMPFTIAAPP